MCGAHGSRRRRVRCPRSRHPTLKLTRWHSKSQTAIEFCWRWCEEKPHFSIFWIYAASIQTFDDAYEQLAGRLGLEHLSPGSSRTNLRHGVRNWLDDNPDWLMVIDNADTYGNFFGDSDGGVEGAISDALPLPRPGSAMILYTSRHARIGAELTEHHHLRINNLSPEDSKSLLYKKLVTRISDESAVALLQALEYLPMSIAHAAAYLNFTKISIQEYLRRVENDADFLELLDSNHVNVGRRHAKAPLSVVKVLLTTLDLLTLHNARAANLLYFMVCLDRQNITAATSIQAIGERTNRQRKACAIELPKSQTELESAIAELESLALITRRDEGHSFAMHRLVQATITQRMSTRQIYVAYLLLCAHCTMELYWQGISSLLARLNSVHLISVHLIDASHIIPHDQETQQSLASYPRGVRVGLSLLCRLGVFSHTRDKDLAGTKRQVAWLKYICLLPMEAILAAAKYDLEVGGIFPPPKFQTLHIMANLCAQKSFEQLERLSLQIIKEGTAHSLSMVAAKYYLARAIANIELDPESTSITRRSAGDLLREASEAADAMQFDGSSSRYHYHHLLINIYLEAGDYGKAIKLQERACEELASIFGPKDLDVLGYRTLLAELKGPKDVTRQELRGLELDLQEMHDRMHNPQDAHSIDDRGALIAINHLSRAKVLNCRKIQKDLTSQTIDRDVASSAAFTDAERILNESLVQMDEFHGMFSISTTRKVHQVHGLFKDFGSPRAASDFAFKRANAMLTQLSAYKDLSDDNAPVIEESIKLFVQHDSVRPLCEKILFTFVRHLQTQRSSRTIDGTTQTSWSPLEVLHAIRDHSKQTATLTRATKVVKHQAVCDECNKVWCLSETHS